MDKYLKAFEFCERVFDEMVKDPRIDKSHAAHFASSFSRGIAEVALNDTNLSIDETKNVLNLSYKNWYE